MQHDQKISWGKVQGNNVKIMDVESVQVILLYQQIVKVFNIKIEFVDNIIKRIKTKKNLNRLKTEIRNSLKATALMHITFLELSGTCEIIDILNIFQMISNFKINRHTKFKIQR